MRAKHPCYYVRIAECDRRELLTVIDKVRTLGSITDSGVSTAKDPKSAWLELRAKDWLVSVEAVRQNFTLVGVDNARMVEVVPIDRGEGKVQAKQLDLFGGGVP